MIAKIPLSWYWSFTQLVLEFQLTNTTVTLKWYRNLNYLSVSHKDYVFY